MAEFRGETVAAGLEAPYTVEYHESIGSTNDRARELAAGGAADVAVLAGEQTGGRGRRGRAWTGPPGGIYCSILRRPGCPPGEAPVFTLAGAVAATRACRAAGVEAHIKWPNDVLVGEAVDPRGSPSADRGGRKLAGVLTESSTAGDRLEWVVVGVGVNANVDPAELPPGATSLRAEIGDVDRAELARRLLEAFHGLAVDPGSVLPAWREAASTLGRQVRVETSDGVVEGEAVDVEFPGSLRVRTRAGEVTVGAGDCEHLRVG